MPLFHDLAIEQLEQLLDRQRETTHQAEQLIVMEQDWGESLFLLRSGLAKVRTYTADGDEVVMSLLGSGDVFGEMAALDGAVRSADVVALSAASPGEAALSTLRIAVRALSKLCSGLGTPRGFATEGPQSALCKAKR